MIKVTIARYGRVPTIVGIVANLEEARTTVKLLDILCAQKALPEELAWYDENTEVWADDLTNGEKFHYMDQDPTGATDGVWFLA